jgi:hypothetical protein
MLEQQRKGRKICLKMLLLVHHPTDSHIGSLFVAGETFASYFVRERRDFELRNTHARERPHTHTHTQTHTHMHQWWRLLVRKLVFYPICANVSGWSGAGKRYREMLLQSHSDNRTSQLVLMMLFIWSKSLIKCYLPKKEEHNMTKR